MKFTLYSVGLGMNIQSVLKSPFTPQALSKFRQSIFQRIPNITVSEEDKFCNIGRIISRPDIGRGIMGLTAILTQPLIDYYNPKVDRDTAEVSTCRTSGKIIAGTLVGCGVRAACYYGVKALTNVKPDAPAIRKSLLPIEAIVQHLNARNADWIKNYRSGLASLIGIGVMLFTNMCLDVPLTNIITKGLLNKLNKHKQKPNKNEILTNPTEDRANTERRPEPYDIRDKFREVFIDKFDDRNKWRTNL